MIFNMPKKHTEVFELHEKKSMKHKEIVKELDISLSNSKVKLKRAKELFKKNLLECCHFEVDTYGNIIDYTQKKDCGCEKDTCS